MKAAQIYEYGPSDVFRVEDLPRPVLKPRDVLVEVHAASVNPIDYKIRNGGQRGGIRYKLPHVLGMDVSGVVIEVGSAVTRFKVGDEVYSSPTHSRNGTYAEMVAIDERAVARKPSNLTHEEAASIPLVGLTAWESLVIKADLKPGEKVLIQAGSGGVGTFAIQLAKAMGAHVITTCSGRNEELVRSLGADEVVDYTKQDFAEVLSELDVVVDALGQEAQHKALKVLRRGGRLACLNAGLPIYTAKYGPTLGLLRTGWGILSFKLKARFRYGVSSWTILRQTDGALLDKITTYLEDGSIRPIIDKVFPLEQIAEAHKAIETGRTRGKIVIAVKPGA
jgi:alcohol dehydrogenase